jgi:hypothetical protein
VPAIDAAGFTASVFVAFAWNRSKSGTGFASNEAPGWPVRAFAGRQALFTWGQRWIAGRKRLEEPVFRRDRM